MKPPVTILLDTEFHELDVGTPDPDLISIGLVAADTDDELHIIIKDGWSRELCSPWVRAHVLPHLYLHGPQLLSRSAAVPRIEEWLDRLREGDREREIMIVSDSPYDWQLLRTLLAGDNKSYGEEFNILSAMVHWLRGREDELKAIQAAQVAFWQQHPGEIRHNALSDARCLKYGFLRSATP